MRNSDQPGPGSALQGQSEAVEAGILRDQFADLKKGLFISMPIGTVLSALILAVQMLSGGGPAAALWFVAVTIINGARIGLALTQPEIAFNGPDGRSRPVDARLSVYGLLALASGIAWSFLAVLSDGYTTPQAPLYL
ncbi:MAG: GGDEF-domain containing protein, partial [Mesorhizobium sp.]